VPIEPSLESAPDLADSPSPPRRCFCLDLQGWIQAVAGLVIALIALLSSYDNIALRAGAKLQLPQQWGVWFIAASVALVVVVAEGFCVAVAQLATGSRLRAAQDAARAADETTEERNRAAAAREQATRRARIQDGCLVAQCRFLLADTSRNRLQLSEALAVLLDELRPPAT
jgi:hypothetical protein